MSVFARAMSLGAILIMLAAYTAPAKAQEQPQAVHGIIFDSEGNPLVGATVVVAGGVQGTTTDTKGKFTLKVKPSDSLTFSYLGYTSQTTKVGSRTKFNIRLEKDASTDIEEVVVIGYGQVAKKDLTGSVSTVKMNDIKDLPTLSVDNALQGRIAGADFMSTTGEPGATTTIRIRGTRSINASNEPLIVVDGVMDAIHDLNDINSDDIASISVLKDASSTAIYGSRGANGVILITTKRGLGTTGKPNITFKTDIGFSQLPRHLDIMNAAEFAQYRNDYASFGSDANHPDIGADTPLSGSVYPDPLSLGEGTDWIKEITRTAIYSNYALSLSGTNEKASYYSSFSYNDTQGIIDDSGQKRFTGRINLERQLFKWLKVGYTGSYTWRHNDQNKATIGGTNWWSGAQYLSPLLKPTDTYNPLYYNGQKINTPRALIDQNTHYLERHSSNHNFSLKLEPIKNFTINSTFSYYLYQRHTYRYYPGTLPMKSENEGGEAYRADWDENSFSWETTAGYKFEKNGHALDVLGGFSAYRFVSHDFNLSGKGYMDDAIMWNNMNAVLDKETYSAGTAYSKKDQDVGLRPSELQLEIALLPHGDRPLRRRLELRGQQQVGILPVGGRQVESGQRELPERLRLDRRPVDSRERRSDRQRRDQHLPFAGRALVHHRRLSVRRLAACRLLPQPSGFARPDMGEDGRLQRGHRLVDVQRTPEHHGRSLQIQDNRSAHVAGRSRPDGLHLALDQYRLDVEQGHRAFDREPEHRAAELPLDDDAHDVA